MQLSHNNQLEGMIVAILGLLLIVMPTSFLYSAIGILMGLILIITNLPAAIKRESKLRKKSFNLEVLRAYFLIILGVGILIWGFKGFAIVVGIIFLIPLLFELFSSNYKGDHFQKNASRYFLIIILIILGLEWVLLAGIILILSGALRLLRGNSKVKSSPSQSESIYERE